MSSNTNSRVWFITGTSNGLGKAFVQQLLKAGQKVAATSRSKENINKLFGPDSDNFIGLQVDLTSDASITKAVNDTVAKFSTIDVVINNAGYSFGGPVEELTDAELKENYQINVFAPITVIRAAAPHMRRQKSGVIVNITSICSTVTFPTAGVYCSTKYALDSLSEALGSELKPFGIRVFTVNPGYIKTAFLEGSALPYEPRIPEYKPLHDAIVQHQKAMNGNQRGDPEKMAALTIKLVDHQGDLPHHIYFGADSIQLAKQKTASLLKEVTEWEPITSKTDVDGYVEPTTANPLIE